MQGTGKILLLNGERAAGLLPDILSAGFFPGNQNRRITGLFTVISVQEPALISAFLPTEFTIQAVSVARPCNTGYE